MATQFVEIYNRFLGKITDDMYVELTPEDTIRDLRNLLLDAIPGFEFPRANLYAYKIDEIEKLEEDIKDTDFVIGTLWDDLDEQASESTPPAVIIENSSFDANLNSEEINILAILMMIGWVQRQVSSIENTRMKYSGTDFKMTSQANHLSKLINLLSECQRQSHHMQRLYKRRRINDDNRYRSNWDTFGYGVYNTILVKSRKSKADNNSNSNSSSSHQTPNGEKLIDECESYWQELE